MKNITYHIEKTKGKIIISVSTKLRGEFDKRVVVRTSQVKGILRNENVDYGKILKIGFVDNSLEDHLVSMWIFEDKNFSGKKSSRKKKKIKPRKKNGFQELPENFPTIEEKTEEDI